jgi:putative membrane protein insertion efficiency factor
MAGEKQSPKHAKRSLLVRFCIALISFYQRWISPRLRVSCRFEPSCSKYAREALETHGFLRGIRLTCWRLWRCRPGFPAGYDPVPDPDYFSLPTFELAEEVDE